MSFHPYKSSSDPPPVTVIKAKGGRLIPLSSLPAAQKKQLWEALKTQNAAKAELLKSLPTDPFFQQLQARYGAEVVMEEREIKSLLKEQDIA